ncbi:precorrin-3B C(17)-methyltransferase [Burkholderia gladioli]|uniref:Precorrin-3B C(17)-methyltransferase n=1 Tax=Burkholderia gladioli TaxID=28095 RepID=A0A2A7S5R8_BURGA|nr:precorrin-3B C(17)-methyltransferase [Burkholderia gladioli]MBU9422668.1 precorrin-3B C(17)-methyltransferase [Burkholderia gladioli]MDN8064909.1 precorrin-3B C(17)-methyltransferase [Burkholderia gladioli]PEH38570.1 precorrin-3B C(17)-methyltransferase [Burkholderia gladioli]QPQ84948.1 precorrin-3B C(17)-methyltransferase [Burkholderia gladioli]
MARLTVAPAIVVLGAGALPVAERIRARYQGATIHALAGRAEGDVAFSELGAHLRALYARGNPVVALCAAGIVIRCVAPCLADKGVEPPVLAVAEDGSAVVPLLGGLTGVNLLAREIAETLGIAPAITTSGELRFGACVLNPPEGYALADIGAGKRFVSDLLAGASTRVDGAAPWLEGVALPVDAAGSHAIRVTPRRAGGAGSGELLIHPRSVVVALAEGFAHQAESLAAPARADHEAGSDPLARRILDALAAAELSPLALAALVAPRQCMREAALARAARELGVPLRFVASEAATADAAALLGAALAAGSIDASPAITLSDDDGKPSTSLAIAIAEAPVDANRLGQARGSLTVLGLGPGRADLLAPAARLALAEATDILGYATYVRMAGPFRADQRVHETDNREELQRARHAFELAAQGRRVAMVSSGDPGVFAMAAAVLEALDGAGEPAWDEVALEVVPGVSAAFATAAEAGAPLGHDFCVISLSDNLKPWGVIEERLALAARADLVMAFYNPISKARPWQLDRALEILREIRAADTVVVLGRDVGRPGASLRSLTLGELRAADVDMRTMVIVGSSKTRRFARAEREWIYTPRFYD